MLDHIAIQLYGFSYKMQLCIYALKFVERQASSVWIQNECVDSKSEVKQSNEKQKLLGTLKKINMGTKKSIELIKRNTRTTNQPAARTEAYFKQPIPL